MSIKHDDSRSKNLEKLASGLEQIVCEAISDLNHAKIRDTDPLFMFKVVLRSFVLRAYYVCQAIPAILRHNDRLYYEAESLSRLLSELLIHAKYILSSKNQEKLSERFLRYDYVLRYKFKKGIGEVDPTQKQSLDTDTRSGPLREEYEKFLTDYKTKNTRTWSGKSLYQMAKEVKELWLYRIVYAIQCKSVHVDSRSVVSCLHEEDGDFAIYRASNPKETERILVTCISLFGQLYAICDDVYGFAKKSWLNEFSAKFLETVNINTTKENS